MRLIHSPVRRSRLYESTLQVIGGKDAKLFPTLREALTFCAVLGYKERRKVALDPNAGTEDIAGAQYQINEAVDVVFALALAYAKNSDILRPDKEKECVQIYEEFANGGLELVESWIERFTDLSVEEAVWRGLNAIGVKPPASAKSAGEVIEPTF
jgi:dnd system-associated protein 4